MVSHQVVLGSKRVHFGDLFVPVICSCFECSRSPAWVVPCMSERGPHSSQSHLHSPARCGTLPRRRGPCYTSHNSETCERLQVNIIHVTTCFISFLLFLQPLIIPSTPATRSVRCDFCSSTPLHVLIVPPTFASSAIGCNFSSNRKGFVPFLKCLYSFESFPTGTAPFQYFFGAPVSAFCIHFPGTNLCISRSRVLCLIGVFSYESSSSCC